MKNQLFKSVKMFKPRRNAFDLSHEKKLSMNMADLVPIYLQEIVPGDKFKVTTEQFIRFAPMIAPVMHRINAYVHYFFVPNRLVWDNWQDYITGGVNGTSNRNLPRLEINEQLKGNFIRGTLSDYLGVPTIDATATIVKNIYINALPFRAYQQIYNDYYRDETLTPEVAYDKGDTIPSADILQLRKRSWEKDYFTSALPWTQRGADVLLPTDIKYTNPNRVVNSNGDPIQGALNAGPSGLDVGTSPSYSGTIENIESIGTTINDLRTAARLQEWLEKNARAGSRYIEQILAHFGVRTPDYRLQRSEYLGGGKTPIVISEVLANFGSDTIPQGNMAGHGVGVGNASGFSKYFDEHGYVIGIMSVLPRTTYTNVCNRTFIKESKFDFYFPEFAHLGEQPIYNKELYFDGVTGDPDGIFGYQSRFAEYKFNHSTVHGEFKTDLEFWHMGRNFTSEPLLNASFIEADPTERIFAVDDLGATSKLYVQLYNDVKAIRPMPVFGTPML